MEGYKSDTCDAWQPAASTSIFLLIGCVAGLIGLAACNSSSKFKPIALDRSLEEYRSSYWTLNSAVEIERLPKGLRCTVTAKLDPAQTPYGGIMVPGEGAKGLRLDMAFTESEKIAQVFFDGFNAQNERVLRWQTEEWPTLRRDRWTYVLLPQEDFEEFKSVASPGKGRIETYHVFLRLKQGNRASFEVYGVGLASAGDAPQEAVRAR